MIRNSTTIIILCGGKGTRMGKLTHVLPKALVSVGSKPILEYKLDLYSELKFFNYVFCVGYKSEVMKKYIRGVKGNTHISDSGINAGILRRIYDAKKLFNEMAIISYGDTYADINFEDLIKRHKASSFDITLVVAPILNPFGLVDWDENNCVNKFDEKPLQNHFIGYMILNKRALYDLPKKYVDLPDGEGIVKMIKYFAENRRVGAYEYNGLKFTVNNKSELEDAEKKIGKYYTHKEI